MQQEKLIYQGAEAKIFLQENFCIKARIKKSYRIAEIDEKLRKLRTRAEAKIMQKLQDKINVPKIIKVDENSKEITMQFIQGKKLSDFLDSFDLDSQIKIIEEIAKETSKMHNENIIHGDLTTSNMILSSKNENPNTTKMPICKPLCSARCLTIPSNKNTEFTPNKSLYLLNKDKNNLCFNDKNNADKQLNNQENYSPSDKSLSFTDNNSKIFFIDFGLSFHSSRIEDKAVDLHLFRQALESRHFQHWKTLFDKFLLAYNPKDKDKILLQLKKVEARGRYK